MRTLPDSPSLDHLRQQAKDLLLQLRVARPKATLSDAQTLVAAQYGFRTWTELKAEVDRRVATDRGADHATAAAVAEAFDLGQPHELVPLGPEPAAPASPRHAAAAGRIVGRVHALGIPAPQSIQRWLTFLRAESQWWDLHRDAVDAGAPWAECLGQVIPMLIGASAIVDPPDPGGTNILSACFYGLSAFRVAGPDDLVVTGWEHAGAIPSRWDLGGALASWSGDPVDDLNTSAARAFLAGYSEKMEIADPLELGIFSAHICSTLNWLATRIEIALRDTDPHEREFAGHTVPTLLVKPPSRANFRRILDVVA